MATTSNTISSAVSQDTFSLDTHNFADFIENSKKLADALSNLKADIDLAKDRLMVSWVGDGRNMFEKKYNMLSIRLGDITTNLYEITDTLIEWEQTYIDQDMELAKVTDGVTKRY